MVTTEKTAWQIRLSNIMKDAWKLFKNGVVSFSLSLKLSWQVSKGKLTNKSILKLLKK